MKSKFIILIMAAALSLTACIKNELAEFRDGIAEIDATSWNANAAGLTYPIITRKPATGRAVNTSDSTLRRYAQTIQVRVNLVGEQAPTDRTLSYETFTSPITTVSMPATISGQTPSAPAATLAVSDAVAGTHYQALSGTVTIPANSSFGIITINILNPGPTAGAARFLGIRITNSGTLKASVNYSQLGLIIDQR